MQTFYVQQLINLRFMKKFVIINSIHAIFFSFLYLWKIIYNVRKFMAKNDMHLSK